MKYVILGGVAAGTKAAAKLKRENPNDEVVIYSKGRNISYAGCGLPYYIGGIIEDDDELIVNTPEKFTALTGVQVYTECEGTSVDIKAKTVEIKGTINEKVSYDKLILAVGAESIIPDIEGKNLNGVFKLRTPEDAVSIKEYSSGTECKRAIVAGAGFIGLEAAENLLARGLSVTVIDMADQLMPNNFDFEMADYIRRHLQKKGIRVITSTALKKINGTDKVTGIDTDKGSFGCDMLVLALGVKPATGFLTDSGIEMLKGAVITNEKQETNIDDIYAVGDCALVKNRITGKSQWSAMGSTANIAARALALNLSGSYMPYPGTLGTAVVKLSDELCAASVGLTEKAANNIGYDTVTIVTASDDKAHYYPGSSSFITKLVADKVSGKLIGAQIIGGMSVDKMADIAVVGISAGLKVSDFITMDFAYAPPFSTAISPFAVAASVLVNKIEGKIKTICPSEYIKSGAKGYTLIDAHPSAKLIGTEWLDITKLDEFCKTHKKDEKILLVCARGKRAYIIYNKLTALGFTEVRTLEGGSTFNVIKRTLPQNGKLSPAEIKRVKGLGCLQDKRFDDVFNVRVITRNGKITAEENRIITEASERFGSGEITMTSRLTMEIQGVKYENIDPLITYLSEHGLETGGTGSLVRPVVSCKGTTCQYGLIDTFGLSDKIHERFYKGYHDVTLPHKFKIAVGGCPNNCVKPDLNDLGIIGQRVPLFDFSKCRGCKKCQVEMSCPIKAATLSDSMITLDSDACNGCGRCKIKCPFGVTEEYTNGYKIYIGGRWGKKFATGKALNKLFLTEEEVLDTVERAILFFRDEGITGERFADTVNRLGFDYVEDKLLNSEIDKNAVLGKTVRGGASC